MRGGISDRMWKGEPQKSLRLRESVLELKKQ
jgi:hypothetical protein